MAEALKLLASEHQAPFSGLQQAFIHGYQAGRIEHVKKQTYVPVTTDQTLPFAT